MSSMGELLDWRRMERGGLNVRVSGVVGFSFGSFSMGFGSFGGVQFLIDVGVGVRIGR